MFLHEWSEKMATDSSSHTLRGYNIEALVVAPVAMLAVIIVAAVYDPIALKAGATAVVAMSPIWLPLFLLTTVWSSWIKYIRFQFWFSIDYVLLEITLPPEVEKSPLAMEVVLTTLWNSGGEATFIQRLWKGAYRPIWSLEIASNEGRVSYYIHTRRAFRTVIESRLYGQFPEAKITEVEDYVAKVPFNLEEYDLWGLEYAKAQPGAVPIKTYYDYAQDKNPDTPEITIDPISNTLELFSSVGKGQYLWLQFIVKARKKDEWYGFYNTKHDSFKDGGKKAIQNMIIAAAERSKKILGDLGIEDKEKTTLKQAASRGAGLLSEDERTRVEAIEKSMSKLIFEAGIRGVYIAKKDRFDGVYNGALVRLFDPYRSAGLNQINPTRGLAIFDYPWQDYKKIRQTFIKKQLYFLYRHRAYFYVPYDQVPVFLNLEELASLWHFPNSSVQPPGLERVAAKRAEAPAGLPI